MPSSRVSGLETRVFSALEEGLLPQFNSGYYFVGDCDWKDIEPNIRRPDIIYFEKAKSKSVVVRPYDIKEFVTGTVRPGQISPLTLLSLYNNDEFREALLDHLSDAKLSDRTLIFQEGSFLVKNIPTQRVRYSGKMARYEAQVPRNEFTAMRDKVRRLEGDVGYFPYTISFKADRKKHYLSNVRELGTDLNSENVLIDTNVKSYIHYENQDGPVITKRIIQCAYKIPESLFKT